MALIDVVTSSADPNALVWKFPSDNLRLGTQLVVKPGQVALFAKGGVLLDAFQPGTYTLQTNNIPLLTKLVSLPFGGATPFQAEVWFVNCLVKLDLPWGTVRPIQLEDPRYGIIVATRAFGQLGVRIADPRVFLEVLAGPTRTFSTTELSDYFRGVTLASVNVSIATAVARQGVSLLEISAHLDEISAFCRERIAAEMQRYGVLLETFYFHSINMPDNDPSYVRLKQLKEKAAELKVVGRDVYQFDRSMDVLKTAAANEGIAGTMMQSGMGLGMGVALGGQIGQQTGSLVGTLAPAPAANAPPPLPGVAPLPSVTFHVALGGQQLGPFPHAALQALVAAGTLTTDTLVWRTGMAEWAAAGSLADLRPLFAAPQPAGSGPPALPRA